MFAKILNALTYKQWIKLISILITTLALFGIFKDSTPNTKKDDKYKDNIPHLGTVAKEVLNEDEKDKEEPKVTTRKFKFKIDIDYEVKTASVPRLKSMALAPREHYIIKSERIVSNEEIALNSYIQINSLWDFYCSDPNFSIQCEMNHE